MALRVFCPVLVGFVLFFSESLFALDAFEIQVYDGKIDEIGEYSLETHLNHTFSAKQNPEFEGQVPFTNLSHMTFEFARGMTPFWEAGAYFQTAMDYNSQLYYGGVKLRSKFVLPGVEKTHFHLGINFEISDIPTNFEESLFGMEIRPIIGYGWDYITVLFNPILDVSLSGSDQAPDFEPALKVMYDTHHNYGLGLEYYADLGAANNSTPFSTAEHYVYVAFDLLNKPTELNIGVGRGLTAVSNAYVGKVIVGFEL